MSIQWIVLILLSVFVFYECPAQPTTNAIKFEQVITGRRTISTQVEFTTQAFPDQSISVEISPVFFHNDRELDERTINRFRVWYEIPLDGLTISPSGYYRIAGNEIRIRDLISRQTILFEPISQVSEDLILNFTIPLYLYQDIAMVPMDATFIVFVAGKELNIVSDDPVSSETDVDDEIQIDDVSVSLPEEIKEEPKVVADDNRKDEVINDRLEELLALNNQMRNYYNQVDAMRFEADKVLPSASQIEHLNKQIDQLKTQFDGIYLSGSFVSHANADRIRNVFNDYYMTSKNILAGLSSSAPGIKTDKTEADQVDSKHRGEAGTKTITYIVLGIAFILIIVAVAMIATLLQKKKSVSMQQKLMRKASMELNKQKFKATQQSRKLKI